MINTVKSVIASVSHSRNMHKGTSLCWDGTWVETGVFPIVDKRMQISVFSRSTTAGAEFGQGPENGRWFQGPVRIWPLSSYCKESTRPSASPCSSWKRPCLNSGTLLCILSFVFYAGVPTNYWYEKSGRIEKDFFSRENCCFFSSWKFEAVFDVFLGW